MNKESFAIRQKKNNSQLLYLYIQSSVSINDTVKILQNVSSFLENMSCSLPVGAIYLEKGFNYLEQLTDRLKKTNHPTFFIGWFMTDKVFIFWRMAVISFFISNPERKGNN